MGNATRGSTAAAAASPSPPATRGGSGGVAVVVGASSGIGEALARALAARGHRVALVARREGELARVAASIAAAAPSDRGAGATLPRAVPFVHDVRDTGAVERLFDEIAQRLGPVDELYFAAGVMLPVERDEFDTEKDRVHFEVNTLGAIAWVNAAARRFSARGHGRIVGVSSVAQDRGRIGRPAYCASKAAMDAHLESVRNRLWRKGVQVTTIRPGFVDTPMTRGAKGLFWLISAERAATLILRAVDRRKSIAYVPGRWRPLMTVIRTIPSVVFRKLDV